MVDEICICHQYGKQEEWYNENESKLLALNFFINKNINNGTYVLNSLTRKPLLTQIKPVLKGK